MLLAIVRAPQADIVRLPDRFRLESVGPTSTSGWTAVWCETLAPLEPLSTVVAVDEGLGRLSLHVDVDGASAAWDWSENPATDAQVLAATQALCRALGPPRESDGLEHRLAAAIADEELVDVLADEFELPDLDESEPRRAVVLHRGDPAGARLAARIVARATGPVCAADLGDAWTVLVTEDPLDADHLAVAVAEGASRRSATLVLWRGAGDARGAWTVSKYARTEATWGTGWWSPGDRDVEEREEGVRGLAAEVGVGVDPEGLRALVAADHDHEPLARLVGVLGLPGEALAVLDERPEAPALERMEPASWRQAAVEAGRASDSWDLALPFMSRWPRTAVAAVLAVMLIMLALTVLSVGVLATGGAFVDQDGVSASDWAFAGISVVLLALYVGLAVVVVGRYRRGRQGAP
ncbi:hypothetical protein [Isoptericola sp. NPDC058082]|uniref:hypothetical protein n=1 Tax=Isoptericola sp. NPDC058082 TaxID=3346331 RepID=UPI0036F0C207